MSVTGAHEALRFSPSGGGVELAPEAFWWTCTCRGQTSADGVLLADVGSALADTGQPSLADWPYDSTLGFGSESPPPAAGPLPWLTAGLQWVALAHDGIEDEIEAHLAAGRAVVLILEVTQEFELPDAEGVIALPPLTAPDGDYHAVLLVGADTDPAGASFFMVMNSWGHGWGVGGFGWLPVSYLEAFAVQAAVVVP